MNNLFSMGALLLLSLTFVSVVIAHPVADHDQPDIAQIIILADTTPPPAPATDNGVITLDGLSGPKASKGIASVEPKGIIELSEEFPAMAGRQLRARLFTVKPGGVVGIHTHIERPGYAFIISGRIMEHRNDVTGAIEHTAGDIAMEKAGVTHWWENTFDEPVQALVVDVFKP